MKPPRLVSVRFAAALLALLAAPALASARSAWSPALGTSVRWHDNITNSDRPADILPAFQTLATATASRRLLLGRDDSLILGTHLTAEAWPRYDGLDRTALGAALAWQHKFGLGPYAPTLRAELAGEAFAARERDRAGRAGTAALVYRQRFATVMRFQLAHEWARTDARALAFDRTGQETSALLSRQFGPVWEFSLAARRRHGTVLAYSAPPRPDLIAKGKPITLVPTFDRTVPMIAYYFDARTVGFELRASRSLGPHLELSLAAEHRDTTHGPESYRNRTLTAALAKTF